MTTQLPVGLQSSDDILGSLTSEPAPEVATLVVLGATGDMATSKLYPALYWLRKAGQLQNVRVLLVAKEDQQDIRGAFAQAIRDTVSDAISARSESDSLAKHLQLRTLSGNLDGADHDRLYHQLSHHVAELSGGQADQSNVQYYLAVPPNLYVTIVEHLVEHELLEGNQTGIIIEKPFGESRTSSDRLIHYLRPRLARRQIKLVDHYLYKNMVRRISTIRELMSTVPEFEPLNSLWNNQHIRDVQITVAESEGIGERGEFYESVGALRDMMQNHLLQLVCALVAPLPDKDRQGRTRSFSNLQPRDVVAARLKIPEQEMRKNPEDWVVRGQYTESDKETVGYRKEAHVRSDSSIETFVAVRLEIDHPDWSDVPFFLRTGKRMSRRAASILVSFENSDSVFFRIQPDPDIVINSKSPTTPLRLLTASAAIPADGPKSPQQFGAQVGRDTAYESIIVECLDGRLKEGVSLDWVNSSWAFISLIEAVWEGLIPAPLRFYRAHTDGPSAAHDLIRNAGFEWMDS